MDEDGRGAIDTGLERHEWETRWAELEPMLRDSPAETLADAIDHVEQMLVERGYPVDDAAGEPPRDEALARFHDARAVALRLDAGEEVDVFDLGQAVETVRDLHVLLIDDRSPGPLSGGTETAP